MQFEFENPWILLLAVLLPGVLILLRWSLVDSPRLQTICSALTRIIILVLLLGALAGSLWVTKTKDVAVLVVADLSDSVSETATNQVTEFLPKLEQEIKSGRQAGLLTFAKTAKTVTPISKSPDFPEGLEKPESGADTGIEEALINAVEQLPADTIKRVLLFSDGNETAGDAVALAKRSAAHGFQIFTMPYEADEKEEVLLEDLIVPSEVKKGQSFDIGAIVHSVAETEADFKLYRNGFKVQEKTMTLKPGSTTLSFTESKADEGLTKYQLRVSAKKDFFADNNVASGMVHIAGEPKILLLEGDERDARYLARALGAENIRVEVREGKGCPGSLDEMAAYDAIIFSDVPATDVSVQQMNLLRSYVEDLGGGFVMIGGKESFGLGGYYRTSIEQVLPVRMRSEKKKDTPSLAMLLIIDKSGSMSGQKMQLAKEAAIATVELLSDRDYVGVVAFDGSAYWAVDLQSAANRMGIVQSIETIEAGGGTSIHPALVRAQEALVGVPSTFKHAILLTDGHSQPGDFEGTINQMVNDRVTVSSVGVGSGADQQLLMDISRWGRGRYYFTSDAYDVPQIFTKETMSASKSSLIEEPFLPQVFRGAQMIRSIQWDTAPFLFGYVVTSAKPTAQVPLISERGDPLLAYWRVGLGKCVAFTSDAKSRWAADWMGWPGYSQFWSQIIRYVIRSSQSHGAETTISFRGDIGSIIVDNTDDSGNFINGLTAQAQIIKPDLEVESIPLTQSAPGRYQSEFPLEETGSYLLKVRQTYQNSDDEEEQVFADYTRALTISYKPEYRHLSTNEELLQELATVTGGKYQPTVEDLFRVNESDRAVIRKRMWPWLLTIALILFLLDVALRRLDLAGRGPFKAAPQRYG